MREIKSTQPSSGSGWIVILTNPIGFPIGSVCFSPDPRDVPDHIFMETEHWFTNDLPERSKSLRHPPAVYLPRPRKRALAGSPVYVCLSLWNSLPVSLRSGSTSDLKVYFDLH